MAALNIVVGISGGIAAYKAVSVVRELVLAGHDVHVVATSNALKFVGLPTLEAISRNPVHTDLYEGVDEVRHVSVGQAADVIVVAPATANTIAKIATGQASDFLGNTILATRAPVIVAPAMHTEMWQNPATVANIETLRSRGIRIVGPESGQLTGSDSGPGRMSEPSDIVAAVLETVVSSRDLVGRSVLVTAGGTREPLDPVRFIGNRSSGKQGVALATAAAARGADVTLIAANLEVPLPAGVRCIQVSTTLELQSAVQAAAESADAIVMAAAVADYRPAETAQSKIKKRSDSSTLELRLEENPDILRGLAAESPESQIVVGFAAETEPQDAALLELGRAKIARKGCDFLVINRVGWTEGFASDRNTVIVIDKVGDRVGEASGSKLSVAHRILDLVFAAR
ncbi:bifunctional phosphopantothenoylcysteine decarboxylase/phosphopantothenate--cysteine ligase CoaBC [Salinibacterium sp. NSLL150]|uniref:bifunctional phosphopantothenoylcysteine decarboxylase/phosphopantothenate--cysteine ligase CoaBC n=1 Tax=unclassified Salinibacterium TaxID=2632331 RepID=UPI0018CD4CA5|nr:MULTISPECIES: bifunctional phosphopantothenoylcysteine decarboxylase/phosphopantothenate--cysteine ligase CoaBC [unclassified Salinibacterium]MBH0099076.1 bifunctional phosphopantothenoylcysteine decarboxylase/phosphopantothenate--cysteine ligase CoaBC [Salinibacterium sp. NSLL35]MBH0101830.1 bifunctional phosphopantothenoylcysteine decarboxylase/phosphopantothenate--cysteine ligase CoaBC [Salinibacterium sp. NSLL150]MBH0104590.1 bifunctional phosphopantothenoylcysteine decarboxylase/phosphop